MNLLIVLGVVVAFGVLRFARASLLLWARGASRCRACRA